ncbi:MAG: hypothetical protein DMG93_07080 [Acidobacteria bacterium]|nr:MAG: hypothetical protein DMG93_07080 [Acidobacteriota bacterium]
MNCGEFERVLPEFLEGEHTREQQAHFDSCSACANLRADLDFISSQAKLLVASEEPRPAVWDALEARLRDEGLIRLPEFVTPKVSIFSRWRTAWLVPVAAALVIAAGIKLYHPAGAGDPAPISKQHGSNPTVAAVAPVSHEDQVLLNTVATRVPAQRARYRADLESANSFIQDAEQSIKDDPNDIYTQQMLINAYAQKQMLYDLAVDRSEQ